MYIRLHEKYPLFLYDFSETLIFIDRFSKNPQMSNFMKIVLLGAELFHADGRTDVTKLIVAFRNFEKVPENQRPEEKLC
jgi:hypothetical protein